MKNKVPKLRFPEFSGEWEEQRLGKIGNIVTGSTPETSKTEYYDGEYLFVSPIDIKSNRYIKNTKTTLTELGFNKGRKIPKMSICFVCIGSTIGKVAQVLEECITNQQINSIIPFKDISNNFIYSCLENKSDKIKLLAGEQAVPLINKSDFSKINIFIPTFSEQEKIASFLSEVDIKIEKLEKKKELLSQYKKGMMQKLFSQKLRFKDENGNDYPEWEESNLEKLAKINPKTEAVPEKFIYIDLESVEKGLLKSENIVLKNEAPSRAQRVLKSNDILYQTVRPYQKNNFYFKNMNRIYPFVASTGYAQIRTSQNSKYLYHFLHTDKFVASVLERCTGTSYPAINSSDLKLIKINIPSLPEQEKIANFLSSIDRKIELVEEELLKNKEFKKGLLQQMFI